MADYIKIFCIFAKLKATKTMQTTKSYKIHDDETIATVNEAEEQYISSKDFFDILRKEVNSHYDNL